MSFFRRDEIREEELAALADGSLPSARRAEVERRVEESPELATLLEEQRSAVSALRSAATQVEAPAALRARIEAERARRAAPRLRRPRVLALGFAAAAAAAALVLLVTIPGGVSGPSIAEAATLAQLPATDAAPRPLADQPKLLEAEIEGVVFPSWDEKFGWRAAGAREDELDGRATKTVFYEKEGKRIAYTIVGGEALDVPDGVRVGRREGTVLRFFESGGRTVVTWERDAKSCVLSGADVPTDTLLKLAAWKGKGAVDF
jgi:anti-sigma factor RsiW